MYKNVSFTMYDIGGHGSVRALYRHYISDADGPLLLNQNTPGLIFVVDASDQNRLRDSRIELEQLMYERDIPSLIYANK